jgi:hypothetical protein
MDDRDGLISHEFDRTTIDRVRDTICEHSRRTPQSVRLDGWYHSELPPSRRRDPQAPRSLSRGLQFPGNAVARNFAKGRSGPDTYVERDPQNG